MRSPIVAVALGALLASTSAFAEQVTFDLSNPIGLLGPSHVYTVGGVSITAYAEGGGELAAKNTLPEDVGLGLTSSPDGEVTPGHQIAFDLSALAGSAVIFTASSTGGGDIFHLYESDSPSSLGTSLFAGTGDNPIDVGVLADRYLIATADFGPTGNGTIVANSIAGSVASPVSEPTSLALFGGALLGLAWCSRRRMRRSEGGDLPFAPSLD